MKVKEIIRVLHAFQKWRRGADIPMPAPKEIGRAIDGAIRELRNYQRMKVRIEKQKMKQTENSYEKDNV